MGKTPTPTVIPAISGTDSVSVVVGSVEGAALEVKYNFMYCTSTYWYVLR